jgi:tetratricopeptide (TPR) repeat protein
MQIIHKIDDFLFTLFPLSDSNDLTALKEWFEDYYTKGPFKPKVTISDGIITIDVDTSMILSQEKDYQKVVNLCNKQKYTEAKPILLKLIEANPSNSEYHRIMGQMLSDEGKQDEAIDCLVESLKWDPKNASALLMMGNIFAKEKDALTAVKYYNQALLINPDDYIAINNIGTNLLNENNFSDAKDYFEKSLLINSEYPNSQFALSLIAQKEGDLFAAFDYTIKTIKLSEDKDVLFHQALRQLFEIFPQINKSGVGEKIYSEFRHKLEFRGNLDIKIIEDPDISTPAKMELAENFKRTHHTVKFRKEYLGVEHLIMHELAHLHFILEAREAETNKLFVSTASHKSAFLQRMQPVVKELRRADVPEGNITKYCDSIFDGLNLQLYNAPIDLFIEVFLNKEYPQLRPYQYVSLYGLLNAAIKSATDKRAKQLVPKDVYSTSKIFNLLNALQFKDLFGVDLISDFEAASFEIKTARSLYEEFLQYQDDKEPGEEYDLIQHWSEDLKLVKNFELIDEKKYRSGKDSLTDILSAIEKDPFGQFEENTEEEREMSKFQKAHEKNDINMAVVMFMVDALKFFKEMPLAQVKKIAIEIAMQGTQGYSPSREDYKLHSIPGKKFSGYHILAWYYVSFKLAIPEQLAAIALPFEKEFALANSMLKA